MRLFVPSDLSFNGDFLYASAFSTSASMLPASWTEMNLFNVIARVYGEGLKPKLLDYLPSLNPAPLRHSDTRGITNNSRVHYPQHSVLIG